jgi:hypothetical protein
MESLTDETTLAIFERYKTKESLEQTHKGSEVFKAYLAGLKDFIKEAKRGGYVELNCGFITDK